MIIHTFEGKFICVKGNGTTYLRDAAETSVAVEFDSTCCLGLAESLGGPI